MASAETSWASPGLTAQRLRTATLQSVLLLCGILSSALYIATDIAGGLSYPGYSFTSQAISELMAIGAPSEPLVDPLFLVYGALAIAFGVGVLRAPGSRRNTLRLTGGLLIGYGVVGLTGPTLFEMHQRGTSNGRGDLPHILITGLIVLLTLSAIGVGAFAFGRRFRLYSFATLLATIVAGVISVPYGARLAAGEPTPGFGIIERIDIYASLLWIAVFSIALLRHPPVRARAASRVTPTAHVGGFVAPELEEVRSEFERDFAERGEMGAAVAACAQFVELQPGARVRVQAPGDCRSRRAPSPSSESLRRRYALQHSTYHLARDGPRADARLRRPRDRAGIHAPHRTIGSGSARTRACRPGHHRRTVRGSAQ